MRVVSLMVMCFSYIFVVVCCSLLKNSPVVFNMCFHLLFLLKQGVLVFSCDVLDVWEGGCPLLGAWSLFVGLRLPESVLGSLVCFGMYVCSGVLKHLSKHL